MLLMCFEHSGESNEFYTQFFEPHWWSCKDKTRVCGYIQCNEIVFSIHLPIFFLQVCVNHLGLFKQILAKWWDKCGCPSIYHMVSMYCYCSSMLCNCLFASKCVGGKKSSLWSNHHIHSNAQKSPTIICGMYWLPILHC